MSQVTRGPLAPPVADATKVVKIRPQADLELKKAPVANVRQNVAVPMPTAEPLAPKDARQPAVRGRQSPPLPRRRKRNRFGLFLSMFFFITVPTSAAAVYYLAYAADQYVTTAKFAIRTQSRAKSGLDNFGAAAGSLGSNIPALADSLIVTEYAQSDQLLKDIRDKVDLYTVYSNPAADWWSRLDPSVSDEGLLDYWRGVSKVHFDLLTGIVTLTVRAFSPEEAEKVGNAVLQASEALVNDLSERAQGDVVKLAQDEVDRSRARLDRAMAAIEVFQAKEQQIDPVGEEGKNLQIQAQLEGEIAVKQAALAALLEQVSATAPSVRLMKGQVASLKAELERMKKRQSTTTPERTSAGERIGDFTALKLEQEIATKLYTNSLSGLEISRQDAATQSRYLVAFVKPKLPDASLYPARFYSIGVAFVLSIMVWLFALLTGAVIREHV